MFEPHLRHCIVVLEQDIYPSLVMVQPRKTCPYITVRLLMGCKESNQINKIIILMLLFYVDGLCPGHQYLGCFLG